MLELTIAVRLSQYPITIVNFACDVREDSLTISLPQKPCPIIHGSIMKCDLALPVTEATQPLAFINRFAKLESVRPILQLWLG